MIIIDNLLNAPWIEMGLMMIAFIVIFCILEYEQNDTQSIIQ